MTTSCISYITLATTSTVEPLDIKYISIFAWFNFKSLGSFRNSTEQDIFYYSVVIC